jgi:Transglutaminase-like superfamily
MKSYWSRLTRRPAFSRPLYNLVQVFLFFRIFLFAISVPALMRWKLPRLRTLMEPRNPIAIPEPDRIQQIATCVEYVLLAARPLVRPGCLTRGLTLYYFLRRAGLDVKLCFGIGKVNDKVVGHCWLLKDGKPFMEKRDPAPVFKEVYSFR